MEIFGVYLVNQNSGLTTSLYPDKDNLIGRGIPKDGGEEGKILLPHPSISKIHAIIKMDVTAHTWKLYDKSRHGLFVNDKKVNKEIRLSHGDKIKVGTFTLMFYEKFKADDETSEQPLPVFEEEHFSKGKKKWFFLAGLFIIEGLLGVFKPKILFLISISLFIFTMVMLFKKEWREKSRISYRILSILFLLSAIGLALAYYSIYN